MKISTESLDALVDCRSETMTKVLSENPKITLKYIKKFENKNNLKLSKEYIEFLLEYNGGFSQESGFR
jgi:hypothetical protein